jgi:hypothetical protein
MLGSFGQSLTQGVSKLSLLFRRKFLMVPYFNRALSSNSSSQTNSAKIARKHTLLTCGSLKFRSDRESIISVLSYSSNSLSLSTTLLRNV